MVLASLAAFLTSLIDYAGLFPPAQLPLEEAITNYGRYHYDPERWMLGRFIIPAARLTELTQIASHLFSADSPFSFSVLGRSGQTAETFHTNLQADLDDIHRFRQENAGKVITDVFEVRLPTADLVPKTADLLAQHGLRTFFETAVTPQDPDYTTKISQMIQAIAEHNESASLQVGKFASGQVGKSASRQVTEESPSLTIDYSPLTIDHSLPFPSGFKLRTGGTEPTAFPSSAQIAHALLACRDAGIPFKATAGLHHPIRHFNDSVQTKMHGFLNVFGAGILAHLHNLDLTTTEAILEDEDPAHFHFSDEAFSWRDLKAETAEIAHLRQHYLLSYGSCSFDEPREDLQQLGFLPISTQYSVPSIQYSV